jgi:hypothetical protein
MLEALLRHRAGGGGRAEASSQASSKASSQASSQDTQTHHASTPGKEGGRKRKGRKEEGAGGAREGQFGGKKASWVVFFLGGKPA